MSGANFAGGTIWTGDNLPIMRGMNDACIDLIYLDPPFNKERDFEAPIRYADADMGKPLQDIIWKLIGLTNYDRKERTGYQCQNKPLCAFLTKHLID